MNLSKKQKEAKSKMLNWKVGALFMKMGSGKTRVAIEIANSIDCLDLVVYVAPLRIIKPKLESIKPITFEVDKWGGFNCKNVVYIGIESIQSSDRIYLELYNKIKESKNAMIICDESIKIKNADSKRTKRMIELSKMVEYKLILNGEPITKNLLDLYSQIQFLDQRILRMDIAEFKNTFCKYTRITKQILSHKVYVKEFITGYENIDYLYSLINPYIYECDLELNISRMFENINYEIDEDSRKSYNEIKEKYLNDEVLEAKNNNIFLEMTQKMQHIYCCTPSKIDKINKWFENVDQSKTIIFCKYIVSRELCEIEFPKATILSYQQDSYGHNLEYLPNIIMFDKIWDLNLRNQALARNFRINSTENIKCLDLTGDVGLETLINKNIEKKIEMSEYFKKVSREQLKQVL